MSRYYYKVGSKRAKRWHGRYDIRTYRGVKDWRVEAALLNHNPITNFPLKQATWWIIETYEGK